MFKQFCLGTYWVLFKINGQMKIFQPKYFLAIIFSCLVFLMYPGQLQAQPNQAVSIVPFDSERWEIHATDYKVEDYLGQKSLFLKGGFASVKDSTEFSSGIIEYDIAFSEERGYAGALWHLKDGGNFEKFYFRPHQSGTIEAAQYTPVFNKITGWQLYPEYRVAVTYPYDEWIHVKIIVAGDYAEVYVRDMDRPIFFIDDLRGDFGSGRVGVEVEDFAPAYFANFSYIPLKNPPLQTKLPTLEQATPETIMSWLVSNTFAEELLDNEYVLSDTDRKNLSWSELNCDRLGLGNLAQVNGIKGDKNTVFARTTIISDREQTKELEFGFSDRIKVYLNNRLIYAGQDNPFSRDETFLGHIGYFDELYLPLEPGENQLWMAISEKSDLIAGWGVQARFKNMNGISVKE